MEKNMEQLIRFSRLYGCDTRYVLAGGGNTSCKTDKVMFVKASGTQLSTIDEDGFVQMDMPLLLGMLEKDYPAEDTQREQAALSDMMAAVLPGQPGKRPSVECLLHAMFPYTFVLHLHPALVNGMTCGKNGEQACRELFGDQAVWIPLTKPGYILAKTCHEAFTAYANAHGQSPKLLFMQNHGVIVAANTASELDELMAMVMERLGSKASEKPNLTATETPPPKAASIAPALRALYALQNGNACVVFHSSPAVHRLLADDTALQPLLTPYNPDQIVYCKGAFLVLTAEEDLAAAFAAFIRQNGYAPKIALVKGVGLFAMGTTKKEADIALSLFLDTVQIVTYADGFGGALPLTKDFAAFILNWEVENYRQKVALSDRNDRPMKGKICIVTGGAQGFGAGIAEGIAAQGGYVVGADMNEQGAKNTAESLCQKHGIGTAMGVGANVADEVSVSRMVENAVLCYGGLDVMVSCAGILIAGGLESMSLENFSKVTSVNYNGYFLCAKYAVAPMKIQRAHDAAYMADIIEINSKSGLEGSKANFAYAGSKFGGIGLTQSFALELAPFGIKVNAICPGNLLDGPLWSDPERGLFRQYLDAEKVPGAKTVEDVRSFYEAKVPLGRGCTVEDVTKAVFYLVGQSYETGQALPVTGGQVMMN